jgi:hypothetical protein
MRFEEGGGARWDLSHRATASRDVALLTPVLTAETIGTAFAGFGFFGQLAELGKSQGRLAGVGLWK